MWIYSHNFCSGFPQNRVMRQRAHYCIPAVIAIMAHLTREYFMTFCNGWRLEQLARTIFISEEKSYFCRIFAWYPRFIERLNCSCVKSNYFVVDIIMVKAQILHILSTKGMQFNRDCAILIPRQLCVYINGLMKKIRSCIVDTLEFIMHKAIDIFIQHAYIHIYIEPSHAT